jgi:prevent-host-death family protein
MKSVNIHQAKTHLSALLARVESGEEVLIAKAGRPIARLVPVQTPAQRELGWDSGLNFWIAEDFDEYLPEEFAEYVE